MELPANQNYTNDEIDIRELIVTLWKAKWLILVITLVFTGAGAIYAFVRTPIYETTAQTLPPTSSGLASYNMAHQLSGPAMTAITGQTWFPRHQDASLLDNSVSELTPTEAYAVFLRHLGSASLRQQFFHTVYLPAHPHVKSDSARKRLQEQLQKALTIDIPKSGTGDDLAKITFEGTNPTHIADWTNTYLQMANEASKNQLLAGLKSATDLRLQSINDQISTLRKVAQMGRQSEIVRLKNALSLAEAVNLEVPPATGNLITSYSGPTTYLRGTKALKAELRLLENRTSDDPYIPELPNLLKSKTLLQKIDLNPQHLTVVTIDQTASASNEPIKPKKLLAILLGIVLGLIVGTVTALMGQTLRNRPIP